MTASTELLIGDEVSWKDEYDKWRGVIVTGIDEQTVEIKVRHPDEDEEEEGNTTALVNITEIVKNEHNLKYVDKKPFSKYYNPPYPQYYFDNISNKHYIIISQNCTSWDKEAAVHFYDIENDEYVDTISYPDNFQPSSHGIAVDSDNHTIYFHYKVTDYAEKGTSPNCFATYNILTKEWNVNEYKDDMPRIKFPRAWFIESSMYFKSNSDARDHIMKYSSDSKNCVDMMQNFPEQKIDNSQMGYDEKHRRIMLFGGRVHHHVSYVGGYDSDLDHTSTDDIWTYDINQDDETGKWELYPLKMPYKDLFYLEIIFGFDSIMFVIYCTEKLNEIWCLELMSKQWFKSHAVYPYELHDLDIIKVNNNHIHCMIDSQVNVRINLYDMIPVELMQFYSGYYVPLINGYVRMEYEQRYDQIHISQDLKQLIAKYFNAFL